MYICSRKPGYRTPSANKHACLDISGRAHLQGLPQESSILTEHKPCSTSFGNSVLALNCKSRSTVPLISGTPSQRKKKRNMIAMYIKHYATCDTVTWPTVAVLGSNPWDATTGLQSPTVTTAEAERRRWRSQSPGEQSHQLAEHRHSAGCTPPSRLSLRSKVNFHILNCHTGQK